MVLIFLLQRIATAVAIDRMMAVALFACALVSVIYGLRRARAESPGGLAGVFAVLVFSIFLLFRPRDGAPLAVVLVVTAIVVILLIFDVVRPEDRLDRFTLRPSGGSLATRLWLGVAVALLLVFLFADLGDYPGWLMVWESPVTEGFAEAFYEGKTLPQHFLTCLAWNYGLVSNSHLTLLYGVLTYGLWVFAGITPLTLRLAAAVLAAACLVAAWFLTRRLGPPKVAAMAVIVLSVNPALIFYGRYGVSLTGTLVGVVVAVLCCALLVEKKDVRWWHGLLTGVVVFVATLGYSPGRLVVVSALILIPILLLRDRRHAGRQRWIAAFLLFAVAATGWALQGAHGKTRFFVGARGEQIFTMVDEPVRIETYLGREVDPVDLTWPDRVEMVRNVLRLRVPEMFRVWGYPFSSEVDVISVVQTDPPRLPLYPPALAVFVIWGVIAALRRPLTGLHPFLFAWSAVVCLPLLLTTRVDVHRLMLIIIPLSLWAALGIQRAADIMVECRVPPQLLFGFAALLLIGIAASNSSFLYHSSKPPVRLSAAVLMEVDEIEGPVCLVFATDHRDLSRVELPLLDRQRHNEERIRVAVSEGDRNDLLGEGGPPRAAINELLEGLDRSTLILAPASRFRRVAEVLDSSGAHIVESGPPNARFWRADRRVAVDSW